MYGGTATRHNARVQIGRINTLAFVIIFIFKSYLELHTSISQDVRRMMQDMNKLALLPTRMILEACVLLLDLQIHCHSGKSGQALQIE